MSALVGAIYLVMMCSISLISKHLEHALIYRSSDIAVLIAYQLYLIIEKAGGY